MVKIGSRRKTTKESNTIKNHVGTVLILISLLLIGVGFKDSIKSFIIRQEVETEIALNLNEALGEGSLDERKEYKKETVWKLGSSNHTPEVNREENSKEHASKGAFIIPKIDQHIAVMDGTGGNNMYRGAGEQYLGQEMGVGNYVLSSHRMYDGKLFARLSEVEEGDSVYLTDYETVYKYTVYESDNNVETTRTELLEDTSQPIITFYGCTPDGVMRVVKQAKLDGYSLIEDLSEEDRALIEP